MKAFVIWVFLFAALSMGTASAQTIGINISESRIWLGESSEITCSWENLSGPAWPRIVDGPYGADFSEEYIQDSPNETRLAFEPWASGSFGIKCTDGEHFSNEANLEVADLTLDVIEFTESLYSDEDLEITAKLTETVESPSEILDWSTEFKVYIGSTELPSPQVYQSSGKWKITSTPSSISPGTQTLKLVAIYNGNQAEYQTQIEILSDMVFDITSLSKDEVTGPENITASLLAQHHGSDILSQATFSVTVNSEQATFWRTPGSLIVSLPDMSPGSYEMKIIMHYDGGTYTRTRTVRYMVPFHGEILDTEGKTVPGKIYILDGDETVATISIDNGKYSGDIPKGDYDVRFETDGVKAEFRDVVIDSEAEDVIKFDSFDSTESLQGLNIVAGFALEFSTGFGRAVITADYDASIVSNENRIDVYKCNSWNIDSRTCSGEFRRIEVTQDLIKNQVSIEVDSLSAFVIGETKDLSIEANVDKPVYSHGERIKLTGVVRCSNVPVPDATVAYTLDGRIRHTTTNSNGVFSDNLDAPENDGPYVMIITASKTLYEPVTMSKEFTVESKTDFKITLPLTAETSNNSSSDFEISVVNTGQTPLTDFTVEITGIPEDWLNFDPKGWSTLGLGEEKRINMVVTPQNPDKNSYIISVKVTSSESSMSDSFVLNIVTQEKSVVSETNQTTQEAPNPFDPLSAYITANSTSLINNGSLLASFFIFIYIVLKFRARSSPKHGSGETSFHVRSHPHTSKPYTIGSGGIRPVQSRANVSNAVKHEILKSLLDVKIKEPEKTMQRKTSQKKHRKKSSMKMDENSGGFENA